MVSTRPVRTLYIGAVVASAEPTVLRTTLGSCIAVCFFDPAAAVGGMNHFMLAGAPHPAPGLLVSHEANLYGEPAMARLLDAMERAGASRSRLVTRVFGGAWVLAAAREGTDDVPTRNIAFVHRYLSELGVQVRSFDVGGNNPRRVTFETWTGRAAVEVLGV
jgi:chemotaxis protein CheD